ncbi:MAG: hypothetical protein ACI89J_002705 [Hyphomicrobiaceae bacterium]|jgi:hypothetical protein
MPRPVLLTLSVAASLTTLLFIGVTHSGIAHASQEIHVSIQHDLADIDEIAEPKAIASIAVPARSNAAPARYTTLTIGGDLGFGGSRQPVSPTAGVRHGRRVAYADLTRNIRGLLIGSDLAFANLETVVTATNSLSAADKKFNFRMHPNGVAHLVKAGFNLLSTANNHSIDYGLPGMRHTIRHMKGLTSSGLLAAHGIAPSSEDLFEPARFSMKNNAFAFAAAGIGGARARRNSPGQVHFRRREDFERVTEALRDVKADYRMLSLHYGQELQVRPGRKNRKKLVDATAGQTGADLVIGHHAHTPAGVQRLGDKLIFYGLGNLLHLGMQDMGKHNVCRDFGVMAKLHLVSNAAHGGRLVAQAVELFALKDMHLVSKVRKGNDGRRRISVINYLSAELADDAKDRVQFTLRDNGSGLYCAPGAKGLEGPVGKLCRGWQPPSPLEAAAKRKLRHACRYMIKQSGPARVAKLRGTITPPKSKKSGYPAFARNAFNPSD